MDQKPAEIKQPLPAYNAVFMTGLILGIVSWLGLALLFIFTLPTLGPRWLLFFLTTMAFTGPVLPIMHYLHRRFPSKPTANAGVIVREALLVGAYADILLWLQFGKVLNFALGIFIAVGLLVVELLVRLRERSRWAPPVVENE